MRSLLVLSALVLVGCASPRHQKLLVDTQSGLFNGESLLRMSGERPQHCYKEDLSAFTERSRKEFKAQAKSALYWSDLGNCLAWHDELREARFFLGLAQDVAKTKDEQAMVKNNIAVIYLREGRISRAYDLLKEAMELSPKFVTPAFNLAQLYISQNINQEGLKLLLRPPFQASGDAEVLHLKGLAYLQMAQIKEAAIYLGRIPAPMQARPDVALTLAQWHVLEGRPDEALDALEKREKGIVLTADRLSDRIEREAKNQIAARELAAQEKK